MDATFEKNIKDALRFMLTIHGTEFVKGIEQLFRNETAHFTSTLFPITWSAGMEAVTPEYPYGWARLAEWWKENPQYKPIGTHKMVENTSELQVSRGERTFIVFPNLIAGMQSVAKDIELLGGFGKWFDNMKADEDKYEETLNSIIPRFTNEILAETHLKE